MSEPNAKFPSLINIAYTETVDPAKCTFDSLYSSRVSEDDICENINLACNDEQALTLTSMGITALYGDDASIGYQLMNYYDKNGDVVPANIDCIINNAALGKIAEAMFKQAEDAATNADRFDSKNKSWPIYRMLAYMNLVAKHPEAISGKYAKYSKLFDNEYNTGMSRSAPTTGTAEISVSGKKLIYSSNGKYAKPMVFSIISENNAIADGTYSYGSFRMVIRGRRIPMRAFRMSAHRYVIIAPEYLFGNINQYRAISYIEYENDALSNGHRIRYSYAYPNDASEDANNMMYYHDDIDYAESKASNLNTMLTEASEEPAQAKE